MPLDFTRHLAYSPAQAQEFSSVGRASVSKTEGRGFESPNSCHFSSKIRYTTLPPVQVGSKPGISPFRALPLT